MPLSLALAATTILASPEEAHAQKPGPITPTKTENLDQNMNQKNKEFFEYYYRVDRDNQPLEAFTLDSMKSSYSVYHASKFNTFHYSLPNKTPGQETVFSMTMYDRNADGKVDDLDNVYATRLTTYQHHDGKLIKTVRSFNQSDEVTGKDARLGRGQLRVSSASVPDGPDALDRLDETPLVPVQKEKMLDDTLRLKFAEGMAEAVADYRNNPVLTPGPTLKMK